jgi:hypothetical protein
VAPLAEDVAFVKFDYHRRCGFLVADAAQLSGIAVDESDSLNVVAVEAHAPSLRAVLKRTSTVPAGALWANAVARTPLSALVLDPIRSARRAMFLCLRSHIEES